MGVRPKVGLPAVYLGDLGGEKEVQDREWDGEAGTGQAERWEPAKLHEAGGKRKAGREGGRCWRHLESSIFLFLPNFVGAEFADG